MFVYILLCHLPTFYKIRNCDVVTSVMCFVQFKNRSGKLKIAGELCQIFDPISKMLISEELILFVVIYVAFPTHKFRYIPLYYIGIQGDGNSRSNELAASQKQ